MNHAYKEIVSALKITQHCETKYHVSYRNASALCAKETHCQTVCKCLAWYKFVPKSSQVELTIILQDTYEIEE